MKIVTDSGTDTQLLNDGSYDIRIVPLQVTLGERTYSEGVDIKTEEFYTLLESSGLLPITSQPSAGTLADVYRDLAKEDPDILSIHISSGLSGTVNAARAAAQMVPEANVTVIDTKTLAAGAGWQVVEAAKAIAAGWNVDRIVAYLARIAQASHSIYTLKDLKYLINGGRISHIKGLVASLLNIKPIIGVNNEKGNYEQVTQSRSFSKALTGLVNVMQKRFSPKEKLVVQVAHASNDSAANTLKGKISEIFDCIWLPMGNMSLVLGAHTGRSMVGVCYAPASVFETF